MVVSNILIFIVMTIGIMMSIIWMFRYQLGRFFSSESTVAEGWFTGLFSGLTPLANLSHYTT